MNRVLSNSARLSVFSLRSTSSIAKPSAGAVSNKTAKFDQAWDESDFRLQRFDTAAKWINPNVAQDLIAQKPPKDCGHERVVSCDGGHPVLGHPRVFINLDKPGLHVCGYCGDRFYNSDVTKSEHMTIHHSNS